MTKMFYPKYWLDATGFWNSHMNTGDNVLLFSTWGSGSGSNKNGTLEVSWGFAFFCLLLTIAVSMYGGVYLAKRNSNLFTPASQQYVQIDI